MPATRHLRPAAAARLGPTFIEAAAEDNRIEDLLDTMDANGTTAAEQYAGDPAGMYAMATGSFIAGFVVAARLSEEDTASLHDILHMLRLGPLAPTVGAVDAPAMTRGLWRDRA